MAEVKSLYDIGFEHGYAKAKEEVEPTKHGRWEVIDDVAFYECKCSECGAVEYFEFRSHFYNYCPNCGAKMDESTMSQVKVDVSIKKPTKRRDTCGLTENSVLVDSGARGEKVDEVEE